MPDASPASSPVVLYHAAYAAPPEHIKASLHNVTPEVIRAQVSWLKRHFDVVPLDALVADYRPGLAAVTFDDGYRSALTEGAEALDDLGVHSTHFLTCGTLMGKGTFWRDKLHAVIGAGLAGAFAERLAAATGTAIDAGMDADTVYRRSKSPAVDSRMADRELDAFLAEHGLGSEAGPVVTDPADLPDSPLLAYGNHTRSHYVLSSLPPEAQREEIRACRELLEGLGLPLSMVLSLPFGEAKDVDADTFAAARAEGYAAVAFSRRRRNGKVLGREHGLAAVERFKAAPDLAGFQEQVRTLPVG